MIIELKTLSFLNGKEQQVKVNKKDILKSTQLPLYFDYREILEYSNISNNLDYLQEDSHSYQIININNIDNITDIIL